MERFYAVAVPKNCVKAVKTALDREGLFNRSIRISGLPPANSSPNAEAGFVVPTSLPALRDIPVTYFGYDESPFSEDEQLISVLSKHLTAQTVETLRVTTVGASHSAGRRVKCSEAVVPTILEKLKTSTRLTKADVASILPRACIIYEPMLLLPSDVKEDVTWRTLDAELRINGYSLALLYPHIALALYVTHIAIDAPIPKSSSIDRGGIDAILKENVLRSPINLIPLHGDFGPSLPPYPQHQPTETDFRQALWVSAKQNGLFQVWSPRYTMFSKGNITEKTRILRLSTVHDAVTQGSSSGSGCSAVDLFSGIGYFAFSYAKAGVSKVLCWDLNPWSIEGLRRGCKQNLWLVSVFDLKFLQQAPKWGTIQVEFLQSARSDNRIIAFCESNENALPRLRLMRSELPPVRHVNCGMLPTSSQVWKDAIEMVDAGVGGWIHLHETVLEKDLDRRVKEVVDLVQSHLDAVRGVKGDRVELEHVEKVKSVGPRLQHIVLDIFVPPDGSE